MKPNNLFIASTGHLKLGDFGLARTYGSPNPKLTPRYRAGPSSLASSSHGWKGISFWWLKDRVF